MFLDITAYLLLFIITSAGVVNISLSDCSHVSSKASFVIYKDLSLSKSASILSIHFELVLVLLVVYATCVSFFVWW